MKLRKLKSTFDDDLSTFNYFIIATVLTVTTLQSYRQLWNFLEGVLSFTSVGTQTWFQTQFIVHTFFINPFMDVLTVLSMLYLFYCLYLASQKLHEREGEPLIIDRPNYTTKDIQDMLSMTEDDYVKKFGKVDKLLEEHEVMSRS
jgi:hypothetical protein